VAVRPLVDTVKAMIGDVVQQTVDRDALRVVASPAAVDRELLAMVPQPLEALGDVALLVRRLRAVGGVDGVGGVALVTAPPAARRVSDVAELRLLELRQTA
jgi:hypothetical protein